MLAELGERVAAQQVWLEFREDAVQLLCAAGYDPENGARPLARAIERLVTRPLSEKLLAGAFQPGDKVSVAAARGEVVFAREATDPDSDLTR
jgi:ATP-dependent Clp protease ATP-binding subunit ClpB